MASPSVSPEGGTEARHLSNVIILSQATYYSPLTFANLNYSLHIRAAHRIT